MMENGDCLKMKVETWPLEKIIPYEKNPRKNDQAVEIVAKSLKQFGWRQPITVDKEGVIIIGHTRLKAAQKLGWETAPVHQALELSPEQVKALRLMDNKSNEYAEWDTDLLIQEIGGLGQADFDLLLTGFKQSEIDEILNYFNQKENKNDPDAVPEVVESICKPGDLWQLGDHRLLCGDSTKAEDVERLMHGEKANCTFIDPPYGMNYKGEKFGKDGIRNDGKEWEETLFKFNKNLSAFSEGVVSICFAPARLKEFFRCCDCLDFHRRLTIYKPNRMAKPWRGWIMTMEDIYLFSIGKCNWNEIAHCHDVYTFDYTERPDKNIDHPTVKPLSIVLDVIKKTSKEGDLVLDGFCGSGTALISCEKINRRCYAMELDPHNCDIIIKRWENYTEKKAERL